MWPRRGRYGPLTMRWPYLFVTTVLNSLYVLDVTTPAQPRLLSTAPYGGADIYDAGQALYIALRGRRREPGGLHLVDAFTAVPHGMLPHLQARGVATLPSADPETHLVNRAYTFNTPGVVQSLALSPPEVPIHAAYSRYRIFGAPQVVSRTSSAMTAVRIGTRSSRGNAIIFPSLAPTCAGVPPWCRPICSPHRCSRLSTLTIRPQNRPASNGEQRWS